MIVKPLPGARALSAPAMTAAAAAVASVGFPFREGNRIAANVTGNARSSPNFIGSIRLPASAPNREDRTQTA